MNTTDASAKYPPRPPNRVRHRTSIISNQWEIEGDDDDDGNEFEINEDVQMQWQLPLRLLC